MISARSLDLEGPVFAAREFFKGFSVKELLWLIGLLFCIFLSVQNRGRVTLHVLFLKFRLQVGLLVLIFVMIGFIFGFMSSRSKK